VRTGAVSGFSATGRLLVTHLDEEAVRASFGLKPVRNAAARLIESLEKYCVHVKNPCGAIAPNNRASGRPGSLLISGGS
jgi:hypothetical protein